MYGWMKSCGAVLGERKKKYAYLFSNSQYISNVRMDEEAWSCSWREKEEILILDNSQQVAPLVFLNAAFSLKLLGHFFSLPLRTGVKYKNTGERQPPPPNHAPLPGILPANR